MLAVARAHCIQRTDEMAGAVVTLPLARPPTKQLSVGQSIARGALALLSVQPLTWAASLLTVVAVPRLRGADTFGQLTIAVTISTLAATTAGLGISEYLVRLSQSSALPILNRSVQRLGI